MQHYSGVCVACFEHSNFFKLNVPVTVPQPNQQHGLRTGNAGARIQVSGRSKQRTPVIQVTVYDLINRSQSNELRVRPRGAWPIGPTPGPQIIGGVGDGWNGTDAGLRHSPRLNGTGGEEGKAAFNNA